MEILRKKYYFHFHFIHKYLEIQDKQENVNSMLLYIKEGCFHLLCEMLSCLGRNKSVSNINCSYFLYKGNSFKVCQLEDLNEKLLFPM